MSEARPHRIAGALARLLRGLAANLEREDLTAAEHAFAALCTLQELRPTPAESQRELAEWIARAGLEQLAALSYALDILVPAAAAGAMPPPGMRFAPRNGSRLDFHRDNLVAVYLD